MDFKKLVQRWFLMMIGVFLAAKLVSGIHYETNTAVIAVVIILSLLNIILRPVLILFALPFVIITMGFGVLLINSFLFLFVSNLVNGFHVDSFGAAFWGSAIIGITSLISNIILGTKSVKAETQQPTQYSAKPPNKRSIPSDDIIDI